MNKRNLFQRTLFVALSAGCAMPAMADYNTLPGTICVSDGPVERPVTGALINTDVGSAPGGGNGTAKFNCPMIRTKAATAYGGTLSFTIYAVINDPGVGTLFQCVVRSHRADGVMHDSTTVTFPSKYITGTDHASRSGSVSLPPFFAASVNLRCNVPNVLGGKAGILSYTTSD